MEHPDMKKVRILIAEDHPLFGYGGYGLRRLVDKEPGLEIIAEVEDGAEAVERALRLQPDVILMDINLPTMNGLEATSRIKRQLEDKTGIVVLSAFHDEEQMLHALRAGASAYFPKDVEAETLIRAIRAVAEGKYVIDDKVMNKTEAERWCKKEIERLAIFPELADVFVPLTPRQMEILKLIARGATNKEIAHKLGISKRTVEWHIRNILRKLGVRDRIQAVLLALRLGWISLEDTKPLK